ncbi:hypothetical protein J2W37_001479 [Variovorax paradoxus]|uniref:Cobalt-zinc-cadmium resistance protein n=1 Tax=Variovorax paradoxus TaxID=34073 RepID=A0AAE3XY06_VARPD|nr:cation efflux protein, CzcI family [Variovorax paradoxus]MDP9963768.1 hypothetical protein [Variovorax paradoxus]MDR6426000.1 hypothetical protein [Variovorax paradoxus]
MRRWLPIFLLLLLPFQFSWAASAAYCQHERDAQPRHWGHHEHEPDRSAGSSRTDDAQNSPGNQPNTALGDCAACHLGQAQHLPSASDRAHALLPTAQAPRAVTAEHFISHISEVPVPPAWPLAL